MSLSLKSAARIALVGMSAGASLFACRDVNRFSLGDDEHYEGAVVDGDFVRSGIQAGVRACLVLDTAHLQDVPGTLTTSDGRFRAAKLRPIPQLWHDPLSTLTFGEGREQSFVYAAAPERALNRSDGDAAPTDTLNAPGGEDTADAMVIVSLMKSRGVEVRVVRGAPGSARATDSPLFGVFTLNRASGSCSF